MIRKIIILSVLLLSSTIMLLHDIIPHHHHEDTLCTAHHHHCDHPADQHHESQQPEKERCCELAELIVFVTKSETFRLIPGQSDQNGSDHHQVFIAQEPFNNCCSLSDVSFATGADKNLSLYSSALSSGTGLRAPPVS